MTQTETQPDLLADAGGKSRTKAKPAKAAAKTQPKSQQAKNALVVDDPAKRQQVAQQQASPPSSMAQLLLEAARDKDVDADKARAMFDLYKDVKAHEAEQAWTRDFLAMQEALPIINRDGKIEVRAKDPRTGERTGALQQSTPYSTYPNLMKVCKPIMHKHGFTFSSKIRPGAEGKIEVVSTLRHVGGHTDVSDFPLGAETSGSKNNVQGWGSSQQYGMRYNAIALLNIITEAAADADANGNSGKFVKSKDGLAEAAVDVETLSEEQLSELNARMVKCKVPLAKVLAHYGLAKLADLEAKLLPAALKQCDDYAENQRRVAEDRRQQDGFPGDRISTGGPRGSTRR